MLPDPLHPAVVHLPMALVMLLPLFALGTLWAIRRGAPPLKAWGLVVGLAALLLGSSWAALKTGEQQEDTVEAVVSEEAIHGHEEAAETFLYLTGGVLLLAGAGLLRGKAGSVGRITATVAIVALVVPGWRVGHLGGELVYTHGAAAAYVDQPATEGRVPGPAPSEEHEEGEGEGGEHRP